MYDIERNTRQARWCSRVLTEKLLDHPDFRDERGVLYRYKPETEAWERVEFAPRVILRGVTRLGF